MVLFVITWILLGLLLGTTAFFITGLVAAVILGDHGRDRIGRWYVSMMMAALQDASMYIRQTGGLGLTRVSSAPKFDGDTATIDGVLGHWRDPLEVKSTLAGKDFGIGLEAASCYISPLLAEFGKHGGEGYQHGKLGSRTVDGDEHVYLDFELPERPQLLDLRRAMDALPGSCKRRWGALGYKWGELSQEKFHELISLKSTMILIMSFAVGVGLAMAVVRLGASGGGGTTISIMISGVPL
ncbi:MAG: hypothetical protein RI560_11210 [Natronomonas sp.]|nr:hypothetical protein [Natronomonas sp.]